MLSELMVNKTGFMCLLGLATLPSWLTVLDHVHSQCHNRIRCDWIKCSEVSHLPITAAQTHVLRVVFDS